MVSELQKKRYKDSFVDGRITGRHYTPIFLQGFNLAMLMDLSNLDI